MAERNGFFYDMQRGISEFFSRWQWTQDPSFLRTYRNLVIDSNTPVLIDTENNRKPYEDCPHVRVVIDRKAEMFANGQWKCVSTNDETIEYPDDEGLKLLRKPNPLQTGEEWLKDWMRYKSIFSNVFVRGLRGSKLVLPKALWFLPSDRMEVKLTGRMFEQTDMKGVITGYIMRMGSVVQEYQPEDLIYFPENYSIEEGKGISKLSALKYPISNIVAALKTNNIITTTQGVKGIWTNESKDAVGNIKMTPEAKEQIEKDFEEERGLYGTRTKTIITDSAMRWNPVGYPTAELLLLEQNEDNFRMIIGAYGMKRPIFPTTENVTYENQNEAEKSVYQSTIQPEADTLGGVMTEYLGANLRDRKYILDYSWLPIMKEDEKKQEEAGKIKAEKLAIMLDKGIIDAETFATEMGFELTGTPSQGADSLGKIPLALQQLALARERANTAGDVALSASLSNAMDILTNQLLTVVLSSAPPPKAN